MKNLKLKTNFLKANEATKGFTLIELLVVIAIIGLLSSIVLASLGAARDKAKDAAVMEAMVQMRSEAELGFQNGTYLTNLCFADPPGGLMTLRTYINTQVSSYGYCGQNTLVTIAPTAWGMAVDLKDGTMFCVDSTGYAGKPAIQVSASAEIEAADPSSDFKCGDG